MKSGETRPLHAFFLYFKSLFFFSPLRFFVGCGLTFLSTLLSGIGLLLLVPLLHYAHWLPGLSPREGALEKMIEYLPPSTGQWPLVLTLFIFFMVMVGIGGLQYVQSQTMTGLRQDYLFTFRQKLNDAVAKAQWAFLLGNKRKHTEHMITSALPQIDTLTFYCIQMLSSSIVIVFYFGFSLLIAFKLTLLTCLVTLILLGLLRKQRALSLGKLNHFIQRKMQEQVGEFLEGLKLAKSYNQTQRYIDYFRHTNQELVDSQKAATRYRGGVQFLFLIATALIFVIIFLSAVYLFHLTILSLMALLVIFARLLPRVSEWQQSYLQVMNIVPVFVEAQNMLHAYQSHAEALDPQPQPMIFTTDIFLDRVSYGYPPQFHSILQQLSCHIKANTTTAIVGPSGAGKTTLADLLLGLLQPSEGTIYVDQLPLNQERIQSWRDVISYVPQEPYFFNDTLRANLLWVAPMATEEMLWDMLKKTAAFDFVCALPKQLDTLLGDRGVRLSGGERQRLALARALLRRPQLLLLDEATSALDHGNEELIYQTLNALRGQITLIIIAHRCSTIRSADQVLVLKQGQLVEQGAPEILLSQKESYFSQLLMGQYAVL